MIDRVTIADRWVSFSSRYGIIAAAPAAPVERSAASPLRRGYLCLSQSAVQSTILFFGVSMRVRIVLTKFLGHRQSRAHRSRSRSNQRDLFYSVSFFVNANLSRPSFSSI